MGGGGRGLFGCSLLRTELSYYKSVKFLIADKAYGKAIVLFLSVETVKARHVTRASRRNNKNIY